MSIIDCQLSFAVTLGARAWPSTLHGDARISHRGDDGADEWLDLERSVNLSPASIILCGAAGQICLTVQLGDRRLSGKLDRRHVVQPRYLRLAIFRLRLVGWEPDIDPSAIL